MSSSESRSSLVVELAEEFLERYRRGERPPLQEYIDRNPELASEIRDVFPAMAMMERIALADESLTGDANYESPVAEPLAFDQLGDFRIVREVGRGGMGIVYEAEQVSLGRHVALKVLPPQVLREPKHRHRFEREARAAAKLHHTNIVPVFGVGEHEGTPYYVMQFIHGKGLDEVIGELKRLSKGGSDVEVGRSHSEPAPTGRGLLATDVARSLLTGPFEPRVLSDPSKTWDDDKVKEGESEQHPVDPAGSSAPPSHSSILLSGGGTGSSGQGSKADRKTYWQSVARIGAQVAEALGHAHRQRVLHRDIKPSNLLLDTRGAVWVADFGLAKTDDQQDLTHTGDLLGTLRYMPPEAFDGKADERGDIYSLGLTLYEMLALRPAFDEKERRRLIRQVTEGEPPRLASLNPDVPRDLATIVHKAIDREPSRRYASADLLEEDLQRFLADRPIRARSIGPLERAWRWSKRNKVEAGAIGAIATALVVVAVSAVAYARQERRIAEDQARATARITGLLASSNRTLALRNFDRGQAAFEKGEIGPGLHWMIQSWRSAAAAGDKAWQHAARANLAAWRASYPRIKAILSHTAPVTSAVFSPDGKTVLTGAEDKTARFWDAATGQPLGLTLHLPEPLDAVAFSPDGKTVATGSRDKTARLWNAATGQPIGQPLRHPGNLLNVAFSPDGQSLLTGGDDKRLWNVATGQPIGQPIPQSGNGRGGDVAFSPDGKSILTGCFSANPARLWDAATGNAIDPPLQGSNFLTSVSFSPDGRTILGRTSPGGEIGLWDAASRKRIRIFRVPPVRAVAYSPDGRTFLSGSADKTARLWNAQTGQPIGPPLQHEGPIVDVEFSPDGKTLLTASSDNTVRLWDADLVQPRPLFFEHQADVLAVAFSPDGKTLLTGSIDKTAQLWNVADGLPILAPLRHKGPVKDWAAAFSPDGSLVLTGSMDHTARLWDAHTGAPRGRVMEHEDNVQAVAFSPDGKTLLNGSDDRTIRLWDADTGTPIGTPLPQPETVDAAAFSPDGKTFVVACSSGTAQLWDLAAQAPLGPPFPHPGCVSGVAFSPDGNTLVTGCEDRMARLWNVASGKLLVPPMPLPGWVFGVAFSPDGKTVATACREGKMARLWDAATGVPIGPPIQHPSGAPSVAFSPDGKALVTGCYDNKARLFQLASELPDDLERASALVEVLTGLSLEPEQGTIRTLDNASWLASRERLNQLGGAPPEATPPPVVPETEHEIALARRFAELEPKNGKAWFKLCLTLVRAGDRQGSEAAFQKAEELGVSTTELTKDAVDLNNTAWLLLMDPDPRKRNVDLALKWAKRAVSQKPDNELLWRTLGVASYRAGDWSAAIEALERSVKLFGEGRASHRFFLAMARCRLNQIPEARADFALGLKWRREHPDYPPSMIAQMDGWQAEAQTLLDNPLPEFPDDVFAR